MARRRPYVVLGDCGYDHDKYRRPVWNLGMKPLITDVAPSMSPASGSIAGLGSARSPTCTGSADCGSIGRSAMTSMRGSLILAVPFSAGGDRTFWRAMRWASQQMPIG